MAEIACVTCAGPLTGRQKRYCSPDCAAGKVPLIPTPGERLFDSYVGPDMPEGMRVLAREAARITDRLELLHTEMVAGEPGLLGEARQQASTLRQLVLSLELFAAKMRDANVNAAPVAGGTVLDDFSRKLAEREAARKGRT